MEKIIRIISNPLDPVHKGIAVRYTMNYEKHIEPLRRLLIEHDAAIVPGFADLVHTLQRNVKQPLPLQCYHLVSG